MFLKSLTVLCFSLFVMSCSMEIYDVDEHYYFTGFAGKVMPLRPTGRISEDQSKVANPCVRTKFDDQNRVVLFEKYLDGILFFRHEYSYAKNGKLAGAKILDMKGNVREESF